MKLNNRATKILNSESGFTLVEILIAIVLLSFLMIGVYTVTDNSTSTIERVSREDSDYAQVGTVINRLKMDFAQIYSPLYFSAMKKNIQDSNNPYATQASTGNKFFPAFSAQGLPIPEIFQASSDELIFFASSNRKKVPDSKESNFCWIQYRLRSMPEDDQQQESEQKRKGAYQLIRKIIAKDPYADDIDWDKVRAQPLLNNVKSFHLSFWSDKKKSFVDSLNDLQKPITIRGIKMILEHYNVNNQLETIEKIFLPLWPKFDPSIDSKKNSGKGLLGNPNENF